MPDIKKTVDKGIAYLKRHGVSGAVKRTLRKAYLAQPVDYEKWLKKHSPKRTESEVRQTWLNGPEIGIFIKEEKNGSGNLIRTRKSVEKQSYGKLVVCTSRQKEWNLPYYIFLTPGTVLREYCVYEMVKALEERPDTEFLYCDHDVADEKGRIGEPFCKPEFDPVFLKEANYIGALCLVSSALLKKSGKKPEDFYRTDIYEDLNCFKITSCKAVRIPLLLYSVMEKSDARHVSELKLERQDLLAGKQKPQISVVIPNKDHMEDLKVCVNSVLELGGYENLEILIVENNSVEEKTFAGYEALKRKDSRIRVLVWEKPYNYSAINNFAADQAGGEYLLFLNNDTKLKKQGSLRMLMNLMLREHAGAAGARLLFVDETIQHGGVVLGYGGVAGHAFEGMQDSEYEKTVYASAARQMSAVTAACMLVKKQAFYEVGGFTEELCVAYNDIDFCMKLQKAGWMVLYDPKAIWYHFESKTRGLEMTKEKAERVNQETRMFMKKWKKEIDRGDRFYSPNLTLELPDFSLIR